MSRWFFSIIIATGVLMMLVQVQAGAKEQPDSGPIPPPPPKYEISLKRSVMIPMRDGVEQLSRDKGQPHWFQIREAVVAAMKPYSRHGVYVNVDFYAGVVYYLHGIPEDLFVPIFAVGRIPGWTVQVLEQFEHNILIRPLLQYVGEMDRPYVPIEERG